MISLVSGAVLPGGLVASEVPPGSAANTSVEPPASLQRQWGLLDKYCSECHNTTDWAGGVAFDAMTPERVPADAEVWENAVRKLRGRLMPPPGKPQPDQHSIDAFVASVESYLDRSAAINSNPGYVPVHRLNRVEYARSVEALLGVKVDATRLLPADGQYAGFYNIATALTVSPTFIDDYLAAAREISLLAVGSPAPAPTVHSYRPAPGTDQSAYIEGMPPGTRGGLQVEHFFPADGEYRFSIGGLTGRGGLEQPNTVILTIDGKKVFEQSLGGDAELAKVDLEQAPAVEAIRRRFENIPVKVTAGPKKVAVTFIAKNLLAPEDKLQPLAPMLGMDRMPTVNGLEIVGPFDPTGISQTPSRARIFTCHPAAKTEETPCAQQIVSRLARQAFRGHATEQDITALMDVYRMGRDEGGFEAGIRKAVMGILVSPKFLFRIPQAPGEGTPANASYPISNLELASRLSFFLWSEMPDAQLLELAMSGRLQDERVMQAQVRRMLADPRSEALVSNFAFQWLEMSHLDEVDPDPKLYPGFNAALREDFRKEMRLFLGSVLREDRPVVELLTANYTFVNERLARHYGIRDVSGSVFRRVTLTDPRRWGLLGKGAVLLATSYGNRTSPVLRGNWILKNIIGTPPAPPPANVNTNLAEPQEGKALTVRARLEAHRQTPSCNQCHGVIDPLGMALENFDAIGQWQQMDRFARAAIDTGGVLADGTPLAGPNDLRRALMKRPDQFVQTLTEKLLMYAIGRPLEYYDMPAVRAITRAAKRNDYRFSSILVGIVTSEPFRMSRRPDPEAKPGATATSTALIIDPRNH